jgi:hypothetical protein
VKDECRVASDPKASTPARKRGAPAKRKYTTKTVVFNSDTPIESVTYHPDLNPRVYKLSLLGMSNDEVGSVLGITSATFKRWMYDYPNFTKALASGREDADANVARSLYQRAIGFSHPDIELKVVSLGGGEGSRVEKVEVTKIYPPDPNAALQWLRYRQRQKWSENQGGTGGNAQEAALAAQAAIRAAWATDEHGGEKRHAHNEEDEGDE